MPGLTLLVTLILGLQQGPPTLPTNAVLTVRVVTRSGLPLPGASVTLDPAPAQGQFSSEQLTNKSTGLFRFPGVTPGTYSVKVEHPDYVPYTRARLAFAAGQTQSLTVALELTRYTSADPVPTTPPPPPPPAESGEVVVGIETSVGTFYIAVDTKRAPISTANFLKYVDGKFYDGGRFHRATRPDNYEAKPPNRPMMNIIQGGIDPAKRSQGFPAIPLERTSVTGIKHVVGVVSMARGTPDSATSDFFVLLDDQPSLDFGGLRFDDGQGGAAFGHVLAGLDVVRRIQQQPVDGQNLSGPVAIRKIWRLAR
jgi:peptidyl-prolyl cis-trans isomerase A (cyclophilin A)